MLAIGSAGCFPEKPPLEDRLPSPTTFYNGSGTPTGPGPTTPTGAATGGTTTDTGGPTGTTSTGSLTTTGTPAGGTATTTGTGTGSSTYSMCNFQLPADTIVVDADGYQAGAGNTYLLCGATQTVFWGQGSTFVVEDQASLVLTGLSANTVYLKSTSDLVTLTTNVMFYYEPGAVIDDQSGGTNPTQLCPVINIDTSLLPTTPC